jgi:hypothetical protein
LTELNYFFFFKINATEIVIAITTATTQPITIPIIAPVLSELGSVSGT